MTVIIIALLAFAGFMLLVNAAGGGGAEDAPPPPSPQIGAVAKAIANAEGSNPEWNNPGDLTASFGYPTKGVANKAGVLIFTNSNDGWNALYKQLQLIVDGQSRYSLNETLAQFGFGYSGGDSSWAVNVANALGVTPDTQLGDILA